MLVDMPSDGWLSIPKLVNHAEILSFISCSTIPLQLLAASATISYKGNSRVNLGYISPYIMHINYNSLHLNSYWYFEYTEQQGKWTSLNGYQETTYPLSDALTRLALPLDQFSPLKALNMATKCNQ